MKTKYLQASFRDVPFLVETSDDEGGGRNVIHEFPGRKEAFAEPSGEYARKFTIEAHLIGRNADGEWFEDVLRRLEDALNEPGTGKLLHPQRGDLFVALDSPYHVKRSTKELGMVRVSMVFVEAGTNLSPRVVPDTSGIARARAATALGSLQNPYRLDAKGPDFLSSAANAIMKGPGGVVAQLSKVNNKINAAFGLIDLVSRQITAFSNEVTTLLNTPKTLAIHLQGLLNAIVSALGAAGADLNRGDKQRNSARVGSTLGFLTAIGTFGDTLPPLPTPTTATRQQQVTNQDALSDLIEASALAQSIAVLVDIPLDNVEQADGVLDQVSAIFDRIEDRGTVDDAQGQALRDLRAAFYAHLRSETAELKTLGRYTPPVTTSALSLAYLLYGDSSLSEDIVERNGIEHPGFLQGGVELVVANG